MRRRKEEAEQTRKKIVSASIKIMNEKGIALTRFEDVANEAKVTRGAIYHYFKSKNEILYAIHETTAKKLFDLFEKHISEITDPVLSLKNGLKEILSKFQNDMEYRSVEMLFLKAEFNNLLKKDRELNEIFKKERQNTIGKLRKLVERGQKLGTLRNDISTESIVHALISFYVGFTTNWYLELSDFTSLGNVDSYIDVVMKGIKSN